MPLSRKCHGISWRKTTISWMYWIGGSWMKYGILFWQWWLGGTWLYKPRHPKPNVIFPQQGWLHPSRGCLLLQRVWIFVHFAPLTKSLCQWRSRRVTVGELYWLLYSYYVFCTALFCHMLGLRLSYYVTWLTLLYTCIATIHIKDRQVLWYLVGASWGGKTLWVQSPRCLLWRALSWLLSKKIHL